MIQEKILELVKYGLTTGLVGKEDEVYTINRLLELFKVDDIEDETFTKVENLSSVARISATDSANIVSTINGKVYTWGLNIYGELGLGDKVNKYEPTLVSDIENIVQVDGGKNHSILLDKNGIVDANDAAIVLDIYKYNTVTRENLMIADMDRNGIIDANDAASILDKYKYGK